MSLFEAIRDAASPPVWSRGVELARGGAVVGEESGDDEIVLKVLPPGTVLPRTVHLWPDDEDWSCDCDGKADPCIHVAAAAIALKHARAKGKDLPAPSAAVSRVAYRLSGAEGLLVLRRVLVRDGVERPVEGAIRSLASGRSGAGGRVLVTDDDLAIEDLMGFRGTGRLPRESMPRLLRLLAGCPDVTLDGEPATASGEPVIPLGVVEDDGRGFVARIVRDPGITRVFQNGVVLCDGALRPIGDAGMSKEQRLHLGNGLRFGPDEVGKLVAEVLPQLRARVQVDVRTKRLPEVGRTPPRLEIEAVRTGEALRVLVSVVYGDPATARVERGELRLLGGPVPLRDPAAEAALVRSVSEGLGLAVGLPVEVHGEAAVRLSNRLSGFGGAKVTGGGTAAFRQAAALVPRVAVEGDRVSVSFSSGEHEADATRVLQAWRAGESLVPVAGAGWAPLPQDWLAQHGERLADLLAAIGGRDVGRVPPHALFDLGRLCDDLEIPRPPALDGLRALLGDAGGGFAGIPAAALPSDLRADLRPYQRRGVDWLGFLRDAGLGGVLADDMGLGKTLQALCAVPGQTLVVAPTSVLTNWCNEAKKFRPDLKVNLYHGPRRALDPAADLTITSYALLRLDADVLCGRVWAAVVLDEAQAIKNPDSQVARAAFRVRADWRLTMTGTPVENRLEELWSQLHFLNPGLLGGRTDFQERYARPIASGSPGAAARLRERLRPFVLRRMKREVAPELPPRTDVVLRATLSASERAVYDAVRAATREALVAKLAEGGGVMAALEALLRLRQASCHPSLVPGQHAPGSSKLDLLLETLDEVVAEGHKALVFSQWTSLLDLTEPHLREAGIPFCRLDGSTRDRGAVVERFQDEAGPPVMLVSLKAGGTGLNLTAADHVFLLDPWWNPAVEDQAADRAHRIGQDRPVLVCRLVAEDTVEERILALQERKRALADAALGEADQATAITRDELLALLA